MEFLIYAFAGVGVMATAWFLAIAAAKVRDGVGKGPSMAEFEQRLAELEQQLPK